MYRASLPSACFAALSLGAAAPCASGQSIERVNLDAAGNQATHGDSYGPALSRDGRVVAFFSAADNLVAGVTHLHVYAHDTMTGTTEVVDVDSSGTLANVGPWDDQLAISADGRFVAFASTASNLVAGDTNGTTDVFLRDRVAHTTVLVSVDSSGTQANQDSSGASISADGSKVAFLSRATNLVAGVTRIVAQVYVRDVVAGTTEIESADASGTPGDYDSDVCSISGDGKFVAFSTGADNLLAADTNNDWDVFVRDRGAGTLALATLDSNGVQKSCEPWTRPSISADGRFVAFESSAQLDVNLSTNYQQIFVRDTKSGTTDAASVTSSGAAANEECDVPVISDDGRFVAFSSWAANLCSDPGAMGTNVFRRDRANGITSWCSANPAGLQAAGVSGDYDNGYTIGLSPDGERVAYWSSASDLVAGDTNGKGDVFSWGAALSLSADPEAVKDGDTITFDAWTGLAGGGSMLVAVDIDGAPTFIPVLVAPFDASGVSAFSAVVPFGLSGHLITFVEFGKLPNGKVGTSNQKLVTFN